MAGYSATPLWKKLGYKDGLTAHVESAYDSYLGDLQLPADVRITWAKQPTCSVQFIHVFATSKLTLDAKLRSFRNIIAPDSVIWVSWPKKSSGLATDITEDTVREIALPLGFVDIKVCAVTEVWSGLKLVVRKELR